MIKQITEWEVETPNGWSSFFGIKQIEKDITCEVEFEELILEGSLNHKIQVEDKSFTYLEDLNVGDVLIDGEKVTRKTIKYQQTYLYDLLDVDLDNIYYTNGIVSHNCAFIERIDEIFTAAQQTLATGGRCLAVSTPNGVGNWFHREFIRAQNSEGKFTPILLPWTVHPERDQTWRDEQTVSLGPRAAAQECDCLWGESKVIILDTITGEERKVTLSELYNLLQESDYL